MNPRILVACSLIFLASLSQAQLNVSIAMTPAQLVQNVLLGGGVTASNITSTGAPSSRASFTAAGTNLGLDAGVILCTGDATTIPGMATSGVFPSPINITDNDLLALSGQQFLNNAAILEFDFVPTGDSLKFRYVFASEEYPTFVCSQYNDAFGFFLSGPGLSGPFTNNAVNIALVPGTSVPITINTINSGVPGTGDPTDCNNADPNWQNNSIYYVDNGSGSTIAFNGFTTVLTAYAQVQCGQTYHIKLAIGNGYDESLQSGVFLEAGSFTSTGQIVPTLSTTGAGLSMNDSTMFEGCGIIPFSFFRQGDTTNTDTVNLVIGGTSTPGVDYYPPLPTQLIYQPGDTVITFPLNVPYDADGLETITINITQNVVCSGTQVISDYTFYIDQYPNLQLVTDDVNGACGQTYDIGPQVTGGTGLYHYLWTSGDTTPTITVSPDTTTTYYFTVTDTCSVPAVMDSITVFIPVYAPMTVDAGPDAAIPCLGNVNLGPAVTNGGNGVYNYLWTHDGSNVGTGTTLNVPASDTTWYRLTAFDECQHSATDSVMVTTIPLPDIQIQSWDSTVFCIGDTMVLVPHAVTGGNGVYTYAWSNGDTSMVLSTADTLQVGVPADSSYTLHVQDQCGYSADSVFTTYIPHYAPFRISLTPDSTICAGDSIALRAMVTGGSGTYTLDWEGWGWSDPVYTYAGDQDAQFTVDVLDHCGEFITAISNVTVQHPEAHILIYNQGQDDWLFQAATVPFVVPVMIWDLGDGTRVKATSSQHSYADLEDHWVTLHTVSAEGCKAVDSLLVKPPGTLFFPNAFTPDGDGINDDWGPTFSSVAELHYVVFDRWGHVVYETDDLHGRWDGTVNGGSPATTGVYVYKYRAKGHYYEANEKYGHVTLVRGSNGR